MRRLGFVGVLAGFLLIAAACGDSDGGGSEGYPAPHDTSVTPYVALEDASVVGAGRYHRRTGDLWHSTWADDGQLYMTWGDGAGRGDCCGAFPGDVVVDPDCTRVPTSVPIFDLNNPGGAGRSICLTGSYCLCEETYFGLAVLGQSPAAAPEHCDADCIVQKDIPTGLPLPTSTRNDKPSSILSVDGTLYIAGHWPPGEATNGWIADSVDHGVTWDESPNSPWTTPSPLTVMMFIQMGQDYGLNVDGWVYALAMGKEGGWESSVGAPGEIYLARVPDQSIADYSAWEYLSAVDAAFSPSWSKEPAAGVPLAGLASSFQGAAIFHPETASYLFLVNEPGGAIPSGATVGSVEESGRAVPARSRAGRLERQLGAAHEPDSHGNRRSIVCSSPMPRMSITR